MVPRQMRPREVWTCPCDQWKQPGHHRTQRHDHEGKRRTKLPTTCGSKPQGNFEPKSGALLWSALSSKTLAKTAPRGFQNPARRHPNRSKIDPGGTYESSDATKSAQEAAKTRPRDAQERPKPAQERPRRVQDRPWRAPNASKNEPGEVQEAFWARLSQTAWFERLPKRFFAIFRVVRVACDMCSDPIKLWFCHIQSVRTVQAHTHAKASKNRRPEAPIPTRNPLKLSPEPLKSHRRTQESAFKSSKTQKSSLKARMCAQ